MFNTLLRPRSILSLLLIAPTALASDLHVDASLNSGANDGSTWANAFQGTFGLKNAMGVAVAGDRIFVTQGTYLPSLTATRNDSFTLIDGVELYGGFVGGESSPAERPPFGDAPTIMSADLAGNDGAGTISDNSYHLIRGGGVSASAVVDGFTMTGGNANGSGNNNKGGGLLTVGGASPTIRNCHIIGNRCTFGGGAGYISGNAAPSYTDVVFENNIGGAFGGAFDMANAGSVRFDRCTFIGNTASRAGAIEIFSTTGVVITNCLIIDNIATGNDGGGGLWIGSGGNTQLRNLTVVGNSSTNQAQGGLRVQGASPTVANCIFWDNSGPGGAQNANNQIGGTASVTYTIVEGGFAGTGNLGTAPSFLNAAGGDYRLDVGSAGIDAGNNASLPGTVTLDHSSAPRYVDDPSVVDSGSGSAPIVDIGAFEFQATAFTGFCFGDGTAAACPCLNGGNAGNGCANGTFAGGSHLAAQGYPSVSSDSLTLIATDSTPGSPGIFFQGDDQVLSGMGLAFGDGLRCAGVNICRIELAFADGAGTAMSTVSISDRCGVAAGETKRMQWWYRDTALSLCGFGFNLSNGIELTWLP